MARVFSELPTPGGYPCGEVTSALQKELRRGHEQEALFWASELELAGYPYYLWDRLRLIATEDVGLADSNVAVQVQALYESWLIRFEKEKKDKLPPVSRIYMIHAVMVIARAPKSRICDHAFVVIYDGDRTALGMEIPDYALDSHTKRGRAMGRGNEFFYAVAGLVENEGEVLDPYRDRAVEIDIRNEEVKKAAQRGR